MATSWPHEMVWPTTLREHLRDTLLRIERMSDQFIPSTHVKNMIMGTLGLLLKVQNAPDFSSIHDVLNIVQTEARAQAGDIRASLEDIKSELGKITESVQTSLGTAEQARAAAKEASEVGKIVAATTRELKSKGLTLSTGAQEQGIDFING